jgi:hypothetical protein
VRIVRQLRSPDRQQRANYMKPDFGELDGKVAQARAVLSLLALLSLYVDPSLGDCFI